MKKALLGFCLTMILIGCLKVEGTREPGSSQSSSSDNDNFNFSHSTVKASVSQIGIGTVFTGKDVSLPNGKLIIDSNTSCYIDTKRDIQDENSLLFGVECSLDVETPTVPLISYPDLCGLQNERPLNDPNPFTRSIQLEKTIGDYDVLFTLRMDSLDCEQIPSE